MRFRVESGILPLPACTYISDRQLPTYRRFFAKEMKASRICFIDSWEENGNVFVKLVTSPDVSEWLPQRYAPYVRAYTDSIMYHDVIEYNPSLLSSSPYTFNITIKPAFTDCVSTRSTLQVIEVDGESCRQVLEGEVTCSVMGIGGYVEAYLRDSLVRIYEQYEQVLTKWAAVREAALADPKAHAHLLVDREFVDAVAPRITWAAGVATVAAPRTGAVAEGQGQEDGAQRQHSALVPGAVAEAAAVLAGGALNAC